MITDYYSILQVSKDDNLETIKKAFRIQIALYHPENNKNIEAKAKFEILIEAFNVLSNDAKRKAYDVILEKSFSNKPIVLSPNEEKTYESWQKDAKKKSKKAWESDLSDVLMLDLFLEIGIYGLFDIFDGLGDFVGDTLGDAFDLF